MDKDIPLLKKEIETGFSAQDKEDLELANSDFSDYLRLVENSK